MRAREAQGGRWGAALAALLFSALPARAAAPDLTDVQITPAPAVESAPVDFSATASDPDAGAALEYRWDFGDGSGLTGWSASPTINHTYADRGSYTVFAQVRDQGGLTDALETTLVVARSGAPATTAARDLLMRRRSSPIVVDAAARRVWVANPDADSVTVLDADTLSVLFESPVGRRPMSVALDDQGRAWVACRDSDEIRVLTGAGATARVLPLARGARPAAVAPSADGSAVYAAEYATGLVRRFDAGTFADGGVVALGLGIQALAVTADGSRLLAAQFISEDAGGRIWTLSLPGFTLAGEISLPLDTTTLDSDKAGRGLPNYVAGLSPDAAGTGAWYAAKKDNILRGQARDGQALTFETVVRALVSRVDASVLSEDVAGRVDIDNVSQPSSVLVDPYGAHLLTTLQGNNALVLLNALDGKVMARAEVGAAPQGVAIDAATLRVFVQNFMGRSVSVFEGDGLLRRGTRTLGAAVTVNTVGTELLPPQVLLGKRLFYSAADNRLTRDGYISCALCHVDGGHDGRTWDFTDRGEGLRNTIPLRGRAGTAQGRVHWTANFDEIQDFEHDIRNAFGGTGLLADGAFHQGTRDTPLGDAKTGVSAEMDALAAYVTSLAETAPSPHKQQDGSLTAQAQAGKLIFQRQNCALCHNGPAFTDSARGQLHDVGTLKTTSGKRLNGLLQGLDTPTLKGLWDTAPYLHDGSAATLQDVMTAPGSAAHGGMDQLTPQERSDLAAYLAQLDDGESEAAGDPVVEILSVEPFAGRFKVTIAAEASVTGVELLAGGSSLGAAARQTDGTYLRVTPITGPVILNAKVIRADGGVSFSKDVAFGQAAPLQNGVEDAAAARPRLLTPGGDGANDAVDFGPAVDEFQVWDSRGRPIFQAAGSSWDGLSGGRAVPSGLYIARVTERGGAVRFRKILVVK